MSSPARLSSDSETSGRSDRSSQSSSDHSSAALILVHEQDDEEQSFDMTEEDDLLQDDSTPDVALAPSVVFGYFLSPHLKLGSMLILSSQAPLKLSIPALVVFAFLSAFSRQIWFLLARYVRNSNVGEIATEAFARGRRKERRKFAVKGLTYLLSAAERILLAVVYLRGAIRCMIPLWPATVSFLPQSLSLSIVFMLVVSPLSISSSLAGGRLVYSTGLSNVLYLAWLGVIIYSHATGALNTDNVMIPRGCLLDDITSVAFAFSSVSNLQIYSGLAVQRGSSDRKEKRYLSISSTSFAATVVGTCLILPVLFPSVKSHGNKVHPETSTVQALLMTITAAILLLAIPPLITTSPSIPFPFTLRRVSKRSLARFVYLVVLFVLSVLPRVLEPVLEDMAVLLVLLSNYFFPALLHIILHIIRRPTSILVNPRPLLRPASGVISDDEELGASGYDRDTQELLLRKERALQRRRLGRRIIWDIGVWILLLPVGGGGMVWAVGRLAHAW